MWLCFVVFSVLTATVFAQVSMVNVPLTIEGTGYDFKFDIGRGVNPILDVIERFSRNVLKTSEDTVIASTNLIIGGELLRRLRANKLSAANGKEVFFKIGNTELPIRLDPSLGEDYIADAAVLFCIEFSTALGITASNFDETVKEVYNYLISSFKS